MLIGVPRETWPGEKRTALVPANVKKLVRHGCDVVVQTHTGLACGFADQDYIDAGASVKSEIADVIDAADLVLRVRQPSIDDVKRLKRGAAHVSFLDPFNQPELIDAMSQQNATAISMEMIPRSTRAQKMDALSSQASLAGYVTVIQAAFHSPIAFPMMMTPSGTIRPARVFVIGAGVAGLQAIATAKRLGARVEAFDTRPVVAEQVRSLGAKFVEIDLGEVGQTDQGYAKALTPEQIELQKAGQKKIIQQSDIVITTAQLFGRPAPRIVTADMIQGMKPGSVIIDMAIETGGNVEGSVLDQIVTVDGVTLIGQGNLPSEVSRNASEMYSNNLLSLFEEFWDDESKTLHFDPDDEIVRDAVITRGGSVVNEKVTSLANA
ncbi:MAG: Re/Si-specific NAD(P)(+) transhydrogenase subunit alpha [Planctomycetota bacterium]